MTDLAAAVGLSQEELAALREAAAPEGPGPQSASLGGGDKRARRKLPILQRESVAFVELVRRMMGRQLRGACSVKMLEFELAGHLGMQHEAETWLLGAALTLPDGPPLAYLGVSPRLGFHLIELAYGAPSTPAKALPPRLRLTKVEAQTLFPSLEMLMGALAKTLLPQDFAQARIQALSTPPELDAGPTTEAGVVTAVELGLGEETVRIGICLSPRALDRLDGGQHDAPAETAVAEASAAAWMRAHVEATQVTVVVDFGRAQVSMQTLANMQPDSLLWLDQIQSDPLLVSVEGHPNYLAMPMQRAGAVGVKIVKRLE